MVRNKGSFKDPDANIFYYNNKIFRKVNFSGEKKCKDLINSDIIKQSIKNNFLINSELIDDAELLKKFECKYLFNHKKIDFISYPYEWNFLQLKKAAMFHLEFLEFLLSKDFHLTDASAFNIQFIGPNPIYIDLFSIERYEDGNHWTAHKQFCESFLNPLILTYYKKIKFNNYYYGNLDGISNLEIKKILNIFSFINPTLFLNIFLPAILEERGNKKNIDNLKKIKKHGKFNKKTYIWMIKSLKKFIKKLNSKNDNLFWSRYKKENTYNEKQFLQKKEIIKEFASRVKPDLMCDIGCNYGEYAFSALENGAKKVIGFDFDTVSLEKAFIESEEKKVNFTPIYLDASKPFSNSGWLQKERYGFSERAKFNALIALAFEHHLAIAKNIPLEEVVKWIVSIAPNGLIEFVPKNDVTVQIMLSNRKDIFDEYSKINFEKYLLKYSNIIRTNQIDESERIIYEYQNNINN